MAAVSIAYMMQTVISVVVITLNYSILAFHIHRHLHRILRLGELLPARLAVKIAHYGMGYVIRA